MASVFVIGGTENVRRHVVSGLLERNERGPAVARDPSTIQLSEGGQRPRADHNGSGHDRDHAVL
jgi:uncharacterized protein YbjT (DUF2867 family)